jgi:hypothetical protein
VVAALSVLRYTSPARSAVESGDPPVAFFDATYQSAATAPNVIGSER